MDRRVTRETLDRILRELPTLPWTEPEIEELVAPRFGAITGFQAYLAELERLGRIDLDALGPAADLRPYTRRS